MMQVPFHKPYITEEEINEVVDSLRSGWLTMGPKTVRFEEEFRKYIGSKHAIAVNSCTAALHLALKAIDLNPGDEVIIPTMTFTATGEVVCYFGAKPVIVDIEEDTLNMSVDALERAISRKTKAVIPVHFAGQPCDMDGIRQIAQQHKLFVVEDAAHAFPAWYKTAMIGTLGDITCFSFYATKTLATGEGGMITTEKNEWAERVRILRLHGISKDAWERYSDEGTWHYEVLEAGYKYNMTDIQAALGLAQLKKAEWMRQQRQSIADRYTEAFRASVFIRSPHIKSDRISAWHLYVIKLTLKALSIDRAQFIGELKKRGVGSSVHFIPLHRHPFYRDNFGYRNEDFPVAEKVYEGIVSLPVYPGMTDDDIEFVVESVRDVCKKFRR
jgi:dTDP-4-amino-4,6-dideoxygalactose transaminase